MCCCMLLAVLTKFVHNNFFRNIIWNTLIAIFYSHLVPVKIIKLLLKLKNIGCARLCMVFSKVVRRCAWYLVDRLRDMRSQPYFIELTARPRTPSAEIVYHHPLNQCHRSILCKNVVNRRQLLVEMGRPPKCRRTKLRQENGIPREANPSQT